MHCVLKKTLRLFGESPRVFGYKIREKSGEVLLLRKRGWKKQTAAAHRVDGTERQPVRAAFFVVESRGLGYNKERLK